MPVQLKRQQALMVFHMFTSSEKDLIGSGLWTEYASNKSYILVSERTASAVTIIVAFALWLSLLRFHRIPRHLSLFLLEKVTGGIQTRRESIALQDISTSAHVAAITHKVVSEEPNPERVLPRIVREYVLVDQIRLPETTLRPKNTFHDRWVGTIAAFRENPIQKSALIVTGLLYFSIAASYQATALFTTLILGHNTAHSADPHSGAWYPDILNPTDMVNTSIFPVVSDLQTSVMFKAVSYAETCYKEKYRKEECSMFYAPNIKYLERHNTTCPFKMHMCSEGPHTAYELDTGWLDTRILGINEKTSCEFRMRKVCSPLVADGYIQTTVVDNVGTAYVENQYGDGWGTVQKGNKTFGEYVRDPNQWHNEPGH
ncbi:hypothetical protein BKA66DRAFT_477288 [Pyrenochaeta sp. MPI-SDFR-AT-0127]|nr:hypothetical protein BKA66DRAFT_477288 [Pyrenochaeta sp. MPI-SDFR-AT-0127]